MASTPVRSFRRSSWPPLLLLLHLLLLLLLLSPARVRSSTHTVTQLPGFDGPLPFSLETGYVDVDETNGVNLFYYFVQSEREPARDPLVLWLQGGPGCSGLSSLIYETGVDGLKTTSLEEQTSEAMPLLETLHPRSTIAIKFLGNAFTRLLAINDYFLETQLHGDHLHDINFDRLHRI